MPEGATTLFDLIQALMENTVNEMNRQINTGKVDFDDLIALFQLMLAAAAAQQQQQPEEQKDEG
jgi:hypothetical protein